MSEYNADLQPISYPIEEAPGATGLTRTHIFGAIRAKKLKARKAGRRTIIERDELANYVKSLPVVGAAHPALGQDLTPSPTACRGSRHPPATPTAGRAGH
jgi:hypothetical protein